MSNGLDDMDADIAAAFDSVSAAAAPQEPAVAETPSVAEPAEGASPELAKATDGPARDEHGRFAKKDETAPEVKAEAEAKSATPATEQLKQAQTQTIAPPLNWNGKGKIDWQRLPASIQKEIADEYQRSAPQLARLQAMDSAIGEQRAQALAATYGSVENAIKSLLAMSDMASRDAGGFIRWFSQQRGIDLAQLVGQGSAQGGEQQPMHETNPFEQKFAQLENRVNTWLQQQQDSQLTDARSELQRFAEDPSHPYFNDVRAEMSALIKLGRASNLQEAYDMAIWAHPTIRASLLEDQKKKLVEAEAAAAAQARNAAVSISGSPAGAKVAVDEPNEDLEATIRRTSVAPSHEKRIGYGLPQQLVVRNHHDHDPESPEKAAR